MTVDNPKARAKTVHVNNLKTYFEREQEVEQPSSSESENEPSNSKKVEQAVKTKRSYRKNPLNPRWHKNQDTPSSSSSSDENELSSDENSESSEDAPVQPKKKCGRPKKRAEPTNKPTTTSRAGRAIIAPDRYVNNL